MDTAFLHLRNGAMAMGRDGLHKPRRSHFFTQIVMSICGQPIIAINEGHKGQGFRQAGELQFLRVNTSIRNGYLVKGSKSLHWIFVLCINNFVWMGCLSSLNCWCGINDNASITRFLPSCLLMVTTRLSVAPSLLACLMLMSVTSGKSHKICSSWSGT